MAAYKFYNQYALKTKWWRILPWKHGRPCLLQCSICDGKSYRATSNEYPPTLPTSYSFFLKCWSCPAEGELVSMFLIQVTDDMNAIDVPSTLPFNFHVSVVLGFSNPWAFRSTNQRVWRSASCRTVMKLLKIASLTLTTGTTPWVWSLFRLPLQTSSSFSLRMKCRWKSSWRLFTGSRRQVLRVGL